MACVGEMIEGGGGTTKVSVEAAGQHEQTTGEKKTEIDRLID